MHGRILCLIALLSVIVLGCDEPSVPPSARKPPRPSAANPLDVGSGATISGRVVWEGDPPVVRPFRSIPQPLTDQLQPPPARDWPNPNAPRIASGGVASSVVFLRGIPAHSPTRSWNHPAVRVELRGQRIHVVQGTSRSNIGFVRAGDSVDLVSKEALFHSVQARGANFFTRTLPDRNDSRACPLLSPGLVELTSGCGYFWMRAYLFVATHPYYTRPDDKGCFCLNDVPPGEYDLVAWHPSWVVVREERNPDNFRVQQVRFGEPIEVIKRIRVQPGQIHQIDLSMRPPSSSSQVKAHVLEYGGGKARIE